MVSVVYVPIAEGGWAITYEDMSERIEAARALAAQRDRFDAALANMPHGLCMFDGDLRLILCNPAYARLYELLPDLTEPGTPLDAILAHRDRLGSSPVDMATYFDVVEEAAHRRDFASQRVALLDGRTIQITHNPMPHGAYVATHEDITASIRAEAEIRHLAAHDALTGLPNRSSLRAKLHQALSRVRGDDKLAVHCLDLDEFKIVNDTLGHAVGDGVLKAVAARFAECLRDSDVLARLGGDEFVILQGGVAGPEDRSSGAPAGSGHGCALRDRGPSGRVGCQHRHRLLPHDGVMPTRCSRKPTSRSIGPRPTGATPSASSNPRMDRHLLARRRLELDLRAALTAGDFQPALPAAGGCSETGTRQRLRGAAALDHPERGAVSPVDFIPARRRDRAHRADRRLGAAPGLQRRRATGPSDVRVAVNLSPVQFRDGNLTEVVFSALTNAGLAGIAARARDDRIRAAARQRSRRCRRCTSCAISASGSRSTISEPAIRRSATCAPSRSTRSRSTSPSSAISPTSATAWPSSGPWRASARRSG